MSNWYKRNLIFEYICQDLLKSSTTVVVVELVHVCKINCKLKDLLLKKCRRSRSARNDTGQHPARVGVTLRAENLCSWTLLLYELLLFELKSFAAKHFCSTSHDAQDEHHTTSTSISTSNSASTRDHARVSSGNKQRSQGASITIIRNT